MKAAIYSNAKSRLLSNHLAGWLDEWVGWLLCVFHLGGRIYIILLQKQKQQPSTTASENDTDQRFGNDRVNQNSELKDAKNSMELRGTADSSTQRLFIYCSYQILIGAPSKGNGDKFGCQGIKHP